MDWITMQNTITLARLAACLPERENLSPEITRLLPLTDEDGVQEAEAAYRDMVNHARARGEVVPYERLCQLCSYNPLAQDVLALALAAFSLPALYGLYQSMGSRDGTTLELAMELARLEGSEVPSMSMQRAAYSSLEKLLYPTHQEEPFFRRSFILDERLYRYLHEDNTLESSLEALCPKQPAAPPGALWIHKAQADTLVSYIWQGADLIQAAGPEGTGRRHLVRHACARTDMPLIEADAGLLCRLEPQNLQGGVWRLGREMLLQESALCLYHIKADPKERNTSHLDILMRQILTPLQGSGYPVFLCTDASVELIPITDRPVERMELEELSRTERMALWEGWFQLLGIENMDSAVLSAKFRLNGTQIQKAALRLSVLSRTEPLSEQQIAHECMLVLPSPALGSLKRQKTVQTLEDLKLPPAQKQVLRNICAHITHRHQVYDVWNMERRYAYGKTVSALFAGPPGTGKTMAAHVLSGMLNLPLYTVDLSQVVDKYIGETEKRLEEIFSMAEKSSSILFFDEADAVFGKRSEVNDAKDRYANTEVAYILQRIEQYDGIVILATNYQKNIDEAFMRRIRYLVHFQMPDETLRRELWQSCFAEETPLEDVDFEFLAKNFELAGGTIKNIALNAAFLAADEGVSIGMSQILRSLRSESIKQGSNMMLADFGPYAYMVQTPEYY